MTELLGTDWLEWAAFAIGLLVLDRVLLWMARRGWIYWRGLPPPPPDGDAT